MKEVGEVLWHSLDRDGKISVYDVAWPDGQIETNIPVSMLESVREGSHNESESHGEQKESTPLKERNYKLTKNRLRAIIKEEISKLI